VALALVVGLVVFGLALAIPCGCSGWGGLLLVFMFFGGGIFVATFAIINLIFVATFGIINLTL